MKITFISDTHTKHRELTKDLPGGEVLIHAGDLMGSGHRKSEIKDFCDWIVDSKINRIYDCILVIAGNHDRVFEKNTERNIVEHMLKDAGIYYLNDSGITVNGMKFYGSPVQPAFCNWAFNRARTLEASKDKFDHMNYGHPPIEPHWDKIPKDVDVLITHGPPLNIMDECVNGRRVGCELLAKKVREIKPKIHVFGHIHEGYGIMEEGGVTYINASSLDERYRYKNKPITRELV